MSPSFCYLMMCQADRDVVLRAAARVRATSPGASIVLRHDRGEEFISAADAAAVGADVFDSTIRVRWGGWSMVEAELEALEHVMRTHQPGWVVMVSGHDYPVRPLADWQDEVVAAGADALVSATPRPGHRRYVYAWHPLPGWLFGLPRVVRWLLRGTWRRLLAPWQQVVIVHQVPRRAGWLVGIRRLRIPFHHTGGTQYMKGSQWMTLSAEAVSHLLLAHRSGVWAPFFQTTRIPDESYLQTLLAADAELVVADMPTTWVRFRDGHPHPIVLDVGAVPEILNAGTAFARKVVQGVSEPALDLIDRYAGPWVPLGAVPVVHDLSHE
jgi:Core-2/I-Branching enzyme